MRSCRPSLFRKRQFEPANYCDSRTVVLPVLPELRHLEELTAERGLAVDHMTIWRWIQRYGPEVHRRLRGQIETEDFHWACR